MGTQIGASPRFQVPRPNAIRLAVQPYAQGLDDSGGRVDSVVRDPAALIVSFHVANLAHRREVDDLAVVGASHGDCTPSD